MLGTSGHGRTVHGFEWKDVPEGLNVADYDSVVLNFMRLEDTATALAVDPSVMPNATQFARLIFSPGNRVVAIGDPQLTFGGYRDFQGDLQPSYVAATWWLPLRFRVVRSSGVAIQAVDDRWAFWFDHVKRYSWHFTGLPWVDEAVTPSIRNALATVTGPVMVEEWPLAETRFQEAIAAEFRLRALRQGASTVTPDAILGESNLLVWLPSPTELTAEEGSRLVLSRVFAVGQEEAPPPWLTGIELPRELEARQSLREREDEARSAAERLAEARRVAEHEARFGRLLYEQGEERLEPVVREALSELGADVQEPEQAGVEDGRLIDPKGRQAMLEIKGRINQLRLEDVRQLDGWVRKAIADEEWEGRGLLVANLKLGLPPDQRTDIVPDNALRAAQRYSICILPTPLLYEALREKQAGTLDMEAWWDRLFACSGLLQ